MADNQPKLLNDILASGEQQNEEENYEPNEIEDLGDNQNNDYDEQQNEQEMEEHNENEDFNGDEEEGMEEGQEIEEGQNEQGEEQNYPSNEEEEQNIQDENDQEHLKSPSDEAEEQNNIPNENEQEQYLQNQNEQGEEEQNQQQQPNEKEEMTPNPEEQDKQEPKPEQSSKDMYKEKYAYKKDPTDTNINNKKTYELPAGGNFSKTQDLTANNYYDGADYSKTCNIGGNDYNEQNNYDYSKSNYNMSKYQPQENYNPQTGLIYDYKSSTMDNLNMNNNYPSSKRTNIPNKTSGIETRYSPSTNQNVRPTNTYDMNLNYDSGDKSDILARTRYILYGDDGNNEQSEPMMTTNKYSYQKTLAKYNNYKNTREPLVSNDFQQQTSYELRSTKNKYLQQNNDLENPIYSMGQSTNLGYQQQQIPSQDYDDNSYSMNKNLSESNAYTYRRTTPCNNCYCHCTEVCCLCQSVLRGRGPMCWLCRRKNGI